MLSMGRGLVTGGGGGADGGGGGVGGGLDTTAATTTAVAVTHGGDDGGRATTDDDDCLAGAWNGQAGEKACDDEVAGAHARPPYWNSLAASRKSTWVAPFGLGRAKVEAGSFGSSFHSAYSTWKCGRCGSST